MAGPNFFIVGAPKCGTTSLYHWLRERPDVFLPYDPQRYWRCKEPYRYCPDLVAPPHRVEAAEYDAMFEEDRGARHRGEATALYLLSDEAPRLIRMRHPDARIIVCLRHPAEFIVAWWRDCLYWGHDDELDFEAAIASERPRASLPEGCWYPRAADYRRAARLSQHAQRWLEAFPREAIHFVWLDDLRDRPRETFAGVLSFLGAAPCGPDVAFAPRNRTRGVRRTLPLERRLRERLAGTKAGDATFRGIESGFAALFRDVGDRIPGARRASLRAEYELECQRLRLLAGAPAAHLAADRSA